MSSLSEGEPASPPSPLPEHEDQRRVSLCEALDRMLNQGVVVAGEVVISVADIDLIYLNLQALLTSVETAYRQHQSPAGATSTCPH
jgi:hypothetical protein